VLLNQRHCIYLDKLQAKVFNTCGILLFQLTLMPLYTNYTSPTNVLALVRWKEMVIPCTERHVLWGKQVLERGSVESVALECE
jgi:hypothetical protein